MGQWNHCQMQHNIGSRFLLCTSAVHVCIFYTWAVNVNRYINSHSKITPTFCISGVTRSLFLLRPQTKLRRKRTSWFRLCGTSPKHLLHSSYEMSCEVIASASPTLHQFRFFLVSQVFLGFPQVFFFLVSLCL